MNPQEPFFVVEQLKTLAGGPYNFSVASGECLTIHGPSGSGKSMILRALADLDEHHGKISIQDFEQSKTPAPLWRKKVTYCPANSEWWFDHIENHFKDIDQQAWAQLNLDQNLLKTNPQELSSGQRQRLAILRALQHKPQCILLDEPSSHLDDDNTLQLESFIHNYLNTHQACAIWISHDPRQRERLGGASLNLELQHQ